MGNVTMDNNGNNNATSNSDLWMKFFLPLQLFIFLATLFGNIMVCIVAYRLRKSSSAKKRGDTNMYILIMCLAVSDLGMAIFFMPLSISLSIFSYEPPLEVCLLNFLPMRYFLGVQLTLLLLLSLDKYFIICTSRKKKLNLTASLLGTFIIPILLLGFPIAHWDKCKVIPQITLCFIKWGEDIVLQLLDFAFTCSLMLISLSVVTISYAAIFLNIRKATKVSIKNGVGSQIKLLRRERRVAMMLLACVMLFWVCWAPIFVFFGTVTTLIAKKQLGEMPEAVTKIIVWLLGINSALHPVVYAFGSQQYRKELRSMFSFMKCRNSMSSENIGDGHESMDLMQIMRVKTKQRHHPIVI